MKRLKTFGKYLLCFIIFFVFSRVIIFIGLNNTYSNIDLKGSIPQGVSITSAKATSVNGEIKGKVSEELNAKYVKFNFYNDLDTLAGSYYIAPSELKDNSFEFYFKDNYIQSYSIELTDEKTEGIVQKEIFSAQQFGTPAILAALFILMFI